jgi:hypothetical protein
LVFAIVAAAAFASPQRAFAQSATEIALAETLYRQARELAAAGKFAEACPKFAESYRLDPGTGTLLNLASCHESLGLVATAWLEYNQALVQSRRDRMQRRIDFAEEHIAALEPKLSHLTIALASDADRSGLELTIDGVQVGVEALGAPTPVDPGTHTIVAKAPSKKPWSMSVEIGAVADQQTLVIPVLEPAPAVPTAASAAPIVAVNPNAAPARDVAKERPIPTSVYVAGGVTLGLAVAAGVTGGVYLHKVADYNDTRFEPNAQSAHDSVVTLGAVNLALWIAAAAGAGATTYLYLTRPAQDSRASSTTTLAAGANGERTADARARSDDAPPVAANGGHKANTASFITLSGWANSTGGGIVAGGRL